MSCQQPTGSSSLLWTWSECFGQHCLWIFHSTCKGVTAVATGGLLGINDGSLAHRLMDGWWWWGLGRCFWREGLESQKGLVCLAFLTHIFWMGSLSFVCDQILFFVIHVLIVMVSQIPNMFKTLCAKYLCQCITLFYLEVIYHELGETGERNVNTEARPSIVALIQAQSRREGGRRDRGTNRPLVTAPPR